MWRAAAPAEQRALICGLVESAKEQLLQLRGAQTGPTAEVARHLLHHLSHGAGLLKEAWRQTVLAAAMAGVPPKGGGPVDGPACQRPDEGTGRRPGGNRRLTAEREAPDGCGRFVNR
ncbi:hypothetical protein [Streptomyces sp. JNUCC 63]